MERAATLPMDSRLARWTIVASVLGLVFAATLVPRTDPGDVVPRAASAAARAAEP